MLKKILVGALLVGMVGLLAFGFVRAFGASEEAHGVSANQASVARGQGGGYGRGQGQQGQGLGAENSDCAPNAQGGQYGRRR